MPKRVAVGVVASDKMAKTRRVEIPRLVRHATYGKIIRRERPLTVAVRGSLTISESTSALGLISLISSASPALVTSATVPRLVNGAFRNYSVVKRNSDLTAQTKSIDITVGWRYKNERFNHSIVSLVSQYQ